MAREIGKQHIIAVILVVTIFTNLNFVANFLSPEFGSGMMKALWISLGGYFGTQAISLWKGGGN